MESYKERHFTWLDAFYDLIVAVIVFELSRELNEDVSVIGFLSFVSLFVPAVWSWVGVTFIYFFNSHGGRNMVCIFVLSNYSTSPLAGIWFVSVFNRLFLWILGMAIDIGTPLLLPRRLSVTIRT